VQRWAVVRRGHLHENGLHHAWFNQTLAIASTCLC
jgi:hypothetical protein